MFIEEIMEKSKKQAPITVRIALSLVIFIAYIWCFTQTDKLIGERFATAGFGLMFGLIFYFLITSSYTGVSKNEALNVSTKPIILVIIVGVIHMLIGMYLGIPT